MAFQLASAYVELSSRGLSSVQGGINSVKGSMLSLTSSITAAGSALLGLAGVAGFGGIMKLTADAEMAAVKLEVLVGSADKARRMIAELQKLDADSPALGFDQLSASANMLLQFGVVAEDVTGTVAMLSEIAAGDAQKLQSLSLAFAQCASAGRLMGQDLLQMTSAGFNPLKVISDKTGEGIDSLRAKMEAGQISFDMVRNAFIDATTAGGRFAGMNERISNTLGGKWSGMIGQIKLGLTELGAALSDGFDFKSIIGSITDFAAGLRTFIPQLRQTVGVIKTFIDNNWGVIKSLMEAGAIIGTVVAGVATLTAGIMAAGAALAFLGPWGVAAIGIVATLGITFKDFFKNVAAEAVFLLANWDITWQLMKAHVVLFVENSSERFKTLGTNIMRIADWLTFGWASGFTTAMEVSWKAIQNFVGGLVDAARAALGALGTLVQGIAAALEKAFGVSLKGVQISLESVFGKMPELAKANIRDTTDEIQRLQAQLEGRRNATTNAGKAAVGVPESQQKRFGEAAAPGGKGKWGELVGLAQLAEKMQTEAANQSKDAKQLAVAEKQAAGIDKVVGGVDKLNMLIERGLRAPPGMPGSNVAFG